MDSIIVVLIVAAAVFVTVKNFVKMFRSDGGCGCNSGCGGCSSQSCTEDFPIAPRKQGLMVFNLKICLATVVTAVPKTPDLFKIAKS